MTTNSNGVTDNFEVMNDTKLNGSEVKSVDMEELQVINDTKVNGNEVKSSDMEELEASTQNMSVEQEQFLKPKKHRRGKKKRQRSKSESENSISSSHEVSEKEYDPYLMIDMDTNEKKTETTAVGPRRGGSYVLIRPLNVPKAPMNSTQFIIDDHEDCGLYLSFEKPHNKRSSRSVEQIQHSPSHYKAAYEDIDYVYECEDWEDSSFCQQDFENVYYKARFDDLIEMEKEDLLVMYKKLEAQACKLQEALSKCDPMYSLNTLQQQLLKLQEENIALRCERRKLKRRTRTNSHSAASSAEDHPETTSSEEEVAKEDATSELL